MFYIHEGEAVITSLVTALFSTIYYYNIKMSERLSSKKMKSSADLSLGADLADSENHDSDIDSAIFQLEMVHIELDKLNDKENDEILTIEQKYKKLRQHYYNKRGEIIETIPDFWSTVVSFLSQCSQF